MELNTNICEPPQPCLSGAGRIIRGVVRLLASLDYRPLTEFPLPDGRRADLCAVDARAGFAIVEVKSCAADFRADTKWHCYREYCDLFFFAVDPQFPRDLLPEDVGVIIADGYTGTVIRPAPVTALQGARRRALLLRFARTASARLCLLSDPGLASPESVW